MSLCIMDLVTARYLMGRIEDAESLEPRQWQAIRAGRSICAVAGEGGFRVRIIVPRMFP